MKMEYKLFGNDTAVLLTRQPEMVYGELFISFLGAPSGATAIFEADGSSLYRSLNEDICSVPTDKLNGEVKVTVALLDGHARPRKWICEEILAKRQKDGSVLISPNDMNLPLRFIELKEENQLIREANERIEKRLVALEDRLERILEGYDLT